MKICVHGTELLLLAFFASHLQLSRAFPSCLPQLTKVSLKLTHKLLFPVFLFLFVSSILLVSEGLILRHSSMYMILSFVKHRCFIADDDCILTLTKLAR